MNPPVATYYDNDLAPIVLSLQYLLALDKSPATFMFPPRDSLFYKKFIAPFLEIFAPFLF